MISRRHFSTIAIVLAILLVWTQQLVAGHEVVHPWHDGGASKHLPNSHTQLCDLCVISAMDGAPAMVFAVSVLAQVRHAFDVAVVAGIYTAFSSPYHSRAPPVVA